MLKKVLGHVFKQAPSMRDTTESSKSIIKQRFSKLNEQSGTIENQARSQDDNNNNLRLIDVLERLESSQSRSEARIFDHQKALEVRMQAQLLSFKQELKEDLKMMKQELKEDLKTNKHELKEDLKTMKKDIQTYISTKPDSQQRLNDEIQYLPAAITIVGVFATLAFFHILSLDRNQFLTKITKTETNKNE